MSRRRWGARPVKVRRATGKTAIAYRLFAPDKSTIPEQRKAMLLAYMRRRGLPVTRKELIEAFPDWPSFAWTASESPLTLLYEEGAIAKVKKGNRFFYYIPEEVT